MATEDCDDDSVCGDDGDDGDDGDGDGVGDDGGGGDDGDDRSDDTTTSTSFTCVACGKIEPRRWAVQKTCYKNKFCKQFLNRIRQNKFYHRNK